MTLRYDQVADLVRIIDASACDELVLETDDLKLVMRRRGVAQPAPAFAPAPGARAAEPAAPTLVHEATERPAVAPPVAGEVRSPMVGTFFRAPSPEAPPFVEVGSKVMAGQPLCVIEVMKLFTTIFAEQDGTVAEIGATNGELVDYGRMLFVIANG